MREQLTYRLAELAVKRGVAVKEGERVVISCPVEEHAFAEFTAELAFKAGAGDVYIAWESEALDRVRAASAEEAYLKETFPWNSAAQSAVAAEDGCFISVRSPRFGVPDGTDPARVDMLRAASAKASADAMKKRMLFQAPWTVVLLPNDEWAVKVYPDLTQEDASRKLVEDLIEICRINGANTVADWDRHNAQLKARAAWLNNFPIHSLQYHNALGTELTLELVAGARWSGGAVVNQSGRSILCNVPTEEIASQPDCLSAEGTVVASRPFLFNGRVIEGMRLTFHKGEVVDYDATAGRDTLEAMLNMDANGASKRLGEVALVPHDSPISRLGTVFYNTIIDENAGCHLALGNAYGPKQERLNSGASFHADFTIGTADMAIDAILDTGKTVPLFRSGTWAGS